MTCKDCIHWKACRNTAYEYAIFELVRLYKIFDWENDDLVLVGW